MSEEANKLGEISIREVSNVMIVGAGTVGKSIGRVLTRKDFNVSYCDTDAGVVRELENNGCPTQEIKGSIEKIDLYFICVPTQLNTQGFFDLNPLRNALHEIYLEAELEKFVPLICICSTILPGTIEDLIAVFNVEFPGNMVSNRICYTPEFLRSKKADEDFESARIRVVASPHTDTREELKKFYINLLGRIVELESFKEGEFLKISHNFINSMEISTWNQLAVIAHHLDLDNIKELKELIEISAEARYSKSYAHASLKPIGGKCLPKDLSALYNFAHSHRLPDSILAGALEFNSAIDEVFGSDALEH
jgi:nucleotide sugar dehydrogenase